MLYTRCPECETTFRITEHALQQAHGQVRCGRCSHIFDARDSLNDAFEDDTDTKVDDAAGMSAATVRTEERTRETEPAQETTAGRWDDAADDVADDLAAAHEGTADDGTDDEGAADDSEDTAGADTGPAGLAAMATETARSAIAKDADLAAAEAQLDNDAIDGEARRDDLLMSADEIDAVLESPVPVPEWIEDEPDEKSGRHAGTWKIAAAAGILLLLTQIVHFNRADIATLPSIGPFLQSAYALTGQSLVPNWDLNRYQLLESVAVEEPQTERGQRNLIIRSRIRNAGTAEQPLPLVHLRLLDRWEETVGARLFDASQYINNAPVRAPMMGAGEIVDAELVIVDPGADTYGFELAVCLEAQSGIVCDNDAAFR